MRAGLLARGQHVLDLGCTPGSWLLYASRKVGPEGTVTGVDLVQPRVALPANARIIVKDVMELDASTIVPAGGFDLVLSDMAPSTTGAGLVDQERSYELVSRALDIAIATLRSGGGFVGKLFLSGRHAEVTDLMKGRFAQVRTLRPRATRSSSREVFLLGKGFGAGRVTPPRAARSPRCCRRPRG